MNVAIKIKFYFFELKQKELEDIAKGSGGDKKWQ